VPESEHESLFFHIEFKAGRPLIGDGPVVRGATRNRRAPARRERLLAEPSSDIEQFTLLDARNADRGAPAAALS
jgi:hypothetical protein